MTLAVCCPGCGASFQRQRPLDPGYLPEGKEPAPGLLCQRCFQMVHYGKFRKAPISDPEIYRQVGQASAQVAAVFLVIDLTRSEGSYADFDELKNLQRPLFVVANKADLVEPWENRHRLHRWISERTGLPASQILVVSSRNSRDMADLRRNIQETFTPEEKLLFLGSANVGKSTLLRGLLKSDLPTASRLPGTTVGLVEHPMDQGPVLIDAPGLRNGDLWLPLLCPQCLTALSPKKELTETVVTLKVGQVLTFGGLAQVETVQAGDRGWIGLAAFGPDEVTIHRTHGQGLDQFLERHCGGMLTPPCRGCVETLASVSRREEVFQVHCGDDLVIPGLGWVAIYSGYGRLLLKTPEFLQGIVRPWLISSPKQRTGKRRRR